MKFRSLITRSKLQLPPRPASGSGVISFHVFDTGAQWMADQLDGKRIQSEERSTVNYSAYGALKYGMSFSAFALSLILFSTISIWLTPLSVLVFYFVEVHFLFLFPLLIDNVERPLRTSVKQAYRSGIVSAVFTVLPIGIFMLLGLFRLTDPLRNWYIGCLAIILWYKDEVRGRI